ncbi:DUF3667 domain-containing protein [Rubrivirga sp. S365]|uniref:DUF3667 domain-containing protein n=1 Tax=Rubrivirga litoralis TaxID=3075598 RepID=A0ABU3BS99_9BACT|nr:MULTISPECIES: DUF3667 domain-containing protein [unclassified Rubrivirga]MDT0632170.1 DUF3667 domain-containing protein [Rubrivirga sp. F394]MDT7857064.1 DUF3667 domain-containing protein [Rubrivirga sp. S365]
MPDPDAPAAPPRRARLPEPTTAPPSGDGACANCGTPLAGRYCSECGQRNEPLRLPVHRFVAQSFTEFFGLDGRVWATLGVLLFKPGKLTAEFLAGRRQRYLRPLRVYLSATLVFFVLLALLDPVGRVRDTMFDEGGVDLDSTVVVAAYLADVEAQIADEPARIARAERAADSLRARLDSLTRAAVPGGVVLDGVAADSLRPALARRAADSTYDDVFDDLADAAADADDARNDARQRTAGLELEAALLRTLPPDSTVRLADVKAARAQIYPEANANIGLPDWMVRSESLRRISEAKTGEESADAGVAFFREAVGKVPTVLFLILPVFALLLKLLYVRRGWYYSEHLVFGLHTHAFAFVVFSFLALLAVPTRSAGVAVLGAALWASIPVYFVVAQKRVYGQGWIRTILKSFVLGCAYFFVLVAGLIGAILLAGALG